MSTLYEYCYTIAVDNETQTHAITEFDEAQLEKYERYAQKANAEEQRLRGIPLNHKAVYFVRVKV